MDDITQSIQSKINELEEAHSIQILFACESGSRAWGFPSIDSDYDVRFIYKHSRDWYLSIFDKRDVIELPVNPLLDINGWDLKKALKLLAKKNATLFEWFQSPIIYAETLGFREDFTLFSKAFFSPVATLHHYLNIARRYYEKCMLENTVKLKAYFYCLRAALAALWICTYNTVPPMELQKLLFVIDDNPMLIEIIYSLRQIKSNESESYMHVRNIELDKFLKNAISTAEAHSPTPTEHDLKAIDTFFVNRLNA